MRQEVLFELVWHEFQKIRSIFRKAEGWNDNGNYTARRQPMTEDEEWNLGRLQGGNCMAWERLAWESLEKGAYPEDTRSCLLYQEQCLFVAQLYGLHKAAEDIRKAMDKEWAGIRDSYC